MTTAPAASSRETAVASRAARHDSRTAEDASGAHSPRHRLSLRATGRPPGDVPPLRAVVVDEGGSFQRCSRVTVLNAWSGFRRAPMRASASSQTSTACGPSADGLAKLPQRGGGDAHPRTWAPGTVGRPYPRRAHWPEPRLCRAKAAPRRAVAHLARDNARGRRHASGVDLMHLIGVFEDIAELPREHESSSCSSRSRLASPQWPRHPTCESRCHRIVVSTFARWRCGDV